MKERIFENSIRIKKLDWLIIGCCWLLLQFLFLKIQGINDQEESVKYITLANRWLSGDRHFSLYNLFYSGYTAIHVLLKWLGLPYKTMYVVQLLFSIGAVYYYIKIISLYICSRTAILFSGIMYAGCFIIQQWVCFLFTDSIFSSLIIITVYFLLTEEKSNSNKRIFWILLFVLPFFRPVGFLFMPVACLYWLSFPLRQNLGKIGISTFYFLIIGFLAYLTFQPDEPYYYPIHSAHNLRANVICGYPDDLIQYSTTPYRNGMSVIGFLAQNPNMTARLFLYRTYKVFSMTRPFFSPWHNRLLVLSTLVYYLFALAGIIKIIRGKKKSLYFLGAGVVIFSIPLIIFCVEWSGRFSLPVLCFVLLICPVGIDGISRFSSPLLPGQYDED
jgi:hypothetical protein